MTQPRIEHRSPGPLANILPTWTMSDFDIYIYIYVYMGKAWNKICEKRKTIQQIEFTCFAIRIPASKILFHKNEAYMWQEEEK